MVRGICYSPLFPTNSFGLKVIRRIEIHQESIFFKIEKKSTLNIFDSLLSFIYFINHEIVLKYLIIKISLLDLQNYNLIHIKKNFLLIFLFSFSLFSCFFFSHSLSKWHSTSEMTLVATATTMIISCLNMVRQDLNKDLARFGRGKHRIWCFPIRSHNWI